MEETKTKCKFAAVKASVGSAGVKDPPQRSCHVKLVARCGIGFQVHVRCVKKAKKKDTRKEFPKGRTDGRCP